jgi:hypothetical protein
VVVVLVVLAAVYVVRMQNGSAPNPQLVGCAAAPNPQLVGCVAATNMRQHL